MLSGRARLVDPGGDGPEPRPAVLIRERHAALHLLDIGGRVEPVGVLEGPIEPVRQHRGKYSVAASAVGRPVEVQAYADRIVIRQDGRIVAEHPRSFGRGETTYDPWHYVPVLARKPGALRNGAPFKDWVLPAAIERIRRRLASTDDGNRQMVDILNAVLTDGLPAVEAACGEALGHGVHSADVVLNILARQREPAPPANIMTPAALTLRHAPIADCARYDNLRRTI